MGGTNDRLRLSVCVDAKTMFEGPQVSQFTERNIKRAAGVLDELCWLRTVINGESKVDAFETELFALRTRGTWTTMVNACKDAHVQLMVGFAHASIKITDGCSSHFALETPGDPRRFRPGSAQIRASRPPKGGSAGRPL
jgi:hypothetical protein